MAKPIKGGKTNKSGSQNTTVQKYQKIFSWAFKKSEKDYNRIVSFQRSYDNISLDSAWPTTSKIPIASFFEAVEKAVPIALDGIFSPSNRIRLHGMEPGITIEQIKNSELALYDLVTYKMKAHRASIPIVKDVFKCSVGFAIVEPVFFSPPTSFQLSTAGRTTRVMDIGEARQTLRIRYVSPSQICVTPDGSNFNGDNPVSVSYLFDSYNEDQLRDMYDDSKLDGEKPEMLGDVEKIIEEARNTGFTSETTIETMVAQMGGISPKRNRPDDELVPCRVPVLKCYDNYKRRHLWIANGTTIIYDKSDEFQTMRCPIIKASAWMDGTRFYPMSTPEAFQKIGWTKNIVINLFLDILTKQLKRPIVYNSELFDKEPTFGPDDKIRTSAQDARMGAAYMEGPRVDATALTFYEYVNQIGNSLTGQRDYMEKNFTRGGSQAFNELLSTTEGMSRLQWSILEMTFVESIYHQALIYLQSTIDEQGVTVRQRKTNKATGKEEIADINVTEGDICHGYELALDLGEKRRFGAMESQMNLAVWDRKMASPYYNHAEVAASLCNSPESEERELKSVEEIKRIQDETRQAELQAQAAGIAKAKQTMTGAEIVPGGQL
ncbi:MAG: hypothetical protein WC373_12320 [Smithella sp.]|jgi:hypothetical protein